MTTHDDIFKRSGLHCTRVKKEMFTYKCDLCKFSVTKTETFEDDNMMIDETNPLTAKQICLNHIIEKHIDTRNQQQSFLSKELDKAIDKHNKEEKADNLMDEEHYPVAKDLNHE